MRVEQNNSSPPSPLPHSDAIDLSEAAESSMSDTLYMRLVCESTQSTTKYVPVPLEQRSESGDVELMMSSVEGGSGVLRTYVIDPETQDEQLQNEMTMDIHDITQTGLTSRVQLRLIDDNELLDVRHNMQMTSSESSDTPLFSSTQCYRMRVLPDQFGVIVDNGRLVRVAHCVIGEELIEEFKVVSGNSLRASVMIMPRLVASQFMGSAPMPPDELDTLIHRCCTIHETKVAFHVADGEAVMTSQGYVNEGITSTTVPTTIEIRFTLRLGELLDELLSRRPPGEVTSETFQQASQSMEHAIQEMQNGTVVTNHSTVSTSGAVPSVPRVDSNRRE